MNAKAGAFDAKLDSTKELFGPSDIGSGAGIGIDRMTVDGGTVAPSAVAGDRCLSGNFETWERTERALGGGIMRPKSILRGSWERNEMVLGRFARGL